MMGTSEIVLLLISTAIVADLTEGYDKCKNTDGNKLCKKRKTWCFKAELQPLMLAGCSKQCGLCDAPDCPSGQMIGEDKQCVDLDCPAACQKKIDALTEQLSKVEDEVEDLKNENSLFEDRLKALEDKKKEKKYTIFETSVDWQTAKTNCDSLSGSAFAEITTLEENQKFKDLIESHVADTGSCSNGFLVGAKDYGNDVWKWTTSNQAVIQDLWGPGEPNGANEKCGVYINYGGSHQYMLNDLQCEISRCYVCEHWV